MINRKTHAIGIDSHLFHLFELCDSTNKLTLSNLLQWITLDGDLGGSSKEIFNDSLTEALNPEKSAVSRKSFFNTCVILYKMDKDLQNEFEYFPNKFYYKDRFIKRGEALPWIDDGIILKPPAEKGLYFIGETHFNPHTNEQFYCVKIGMSINLKQKFNGYKSSNPQLWSIDYRVSESSPADLYNEEAEFQDKLAQNAIGKNYRNKEWFFVSRETYLEMCEKGFNFFS